MTHTEEHKSGKVQTIAGPKSAEDVCKAMNGVYDTSSGNCTYRNRKHSKEYPCKLTVSESFASDEKGSCYTYQQSGTKSHHGGSQMYRFGSEECKDKYASFEKHSQEICSTAASFSTDKGTALVEPVPTTCSRLNSKKSCNAAASEGKGCFWQGKVQTISCTEWGEEACRSMCTAMQGTLYESDPKSENSLQCMLPECTFGEIG